MKTIVFPAVHTQFDMRRANPVLPAVQPPRRPHTPEGIGPRLRRSRQWVVREGGADVGRQTLGRFNLILM